MSTVTEERPATPDAAAELSLWRDVPAAPKLFTFILFNTASFQIALGPPLYLMARQWGASTLYIGAIASLVPPAGHAPALDGSARRKPRLQARHALGLDRPQHRPCC